MPVTSINSQLGPGTWEDQRWKGSEIRLHATERWISEI